MRPRGRARPARGPRPRSRTDGQSSQRRCRPPRRGAEAGPGRPAARGGRRPRPARRGRRRPPPPPPPRGPPPPPPPPAGGAPRGPPPPAGGEPAKKKKKAAGVPPRRGKKLRNHLKNQAQRLSKEGVVPVRKAVQ